MFCLRHFDKLYGWAGIPARIFDQLVEFPYKSLCRIEDSHEKKVALIATGES